MATEACKQLTKHYIYMYICIYIHIYIYIYIRKSARKLERKGYREHELGVYICKGVVYRLQALNAGTQTHTHTHTHWQQSMGLQTINKTLYIHVYTI